MSTSPTPVNGSPGTNRDFASDLVLASRMITAARDYADMALGVLYTVAQKKAAVSVTLLETANQQVHSRSVVALVTAEGALTPDPLPRADLLPSPEQVESLRRGLPITPDVQQVSELTLSELAPLKIAWMASFALRTDDNVLGTLDILHTEPCDLTTEEIDAYTVLADQIGVAVRSQRLLEQTQNALDETRTLYEINRAILSAQDTLDVLRALRQHFTPEAASISHSRLTYDADNRIQAITVDFISLPAEEQVVDIPLGTIIGPDKLSQLHQIWNSQIDPITFVEDAAVSDDPFSNALQETGVLSYVTITLRQQGLVQETIHLGFAAPQVFDEYQRRLYEAVADQISIVLQNHRLLYESQVSANELSKQVRLLQLINQLATTITSIQDEKTLLDKSCRAMIEATGLDHSSIALITAAGNAAQVISEYPMKGTVGVQIPLADNAVYDIVRETRRPLVVADVDNDTHLPAASQHLLQRMGVRAMLVIPLFASEKLIGSIGLDVYTLEKPITPEVVEAALSVTAQVGLGMQNTRLLAEAERRARQLQRITAFSQSVQATLDMPTIFTNMLKESAHMLTQDQMSISLYDSRHDALRVVAEHSGGRTLVNGDGGDLIPISGHVATVWNSHEMLHIPDLYKQRDQSNPQSDIRAWMVAPILVRGRILGLISVGSIRPYAYTETDVVLFQQMVTQLAVAIENVEAYTQSQRMVKNESLLNTISTQLQTQMNIERMMDITAHELGKALGARRARIRFGSPDNGSS